MNEIIILSSARRAILARLSSLGRQFCDDDVNEMVSMTVERFYTRGSYDPSKASVQTYVSRIASNVVYDFVKAYDRDRLRYIRLDAIPEESQDEDKPIKDDPTQNLWFGDSRKADTVLIAKEREALMEWAKNRLNPRLREYYDLIAEGLSHDEIACLTGTTTGNVGAIVYRMRKQFRALFEEVA